jgi:hypothetical protein
MIIGISTAAWGNSTTGKCNSFTGSLTQLLHNERGQCAQRGEAIGIGIVFLIIGIMLIIVGANSKEKEQTVY